MKAFIILLLSLTTFALSAQNTKTTTFKVWGNCEMCKKTIENAVDKKGVKNAFWNETTHIITIKFNEKKINEEQLHKLIASAGYDTEKEKADDKVYNALPGCCKYVRKD